MIDKLSQSPVRTEYANTENGNASKRKMVNDSSKKQLPGFNKNFENCLE